MNPRVLLLFFISSAFAACPKGTIFHYQFNKCYKHISQATSFVLAEKNCESMGGSLVSISNIYENTYISDLAAGESSDQFWIGLNFLASPQWTWADENPASYRNWAPLQPQGQNLCAAVNVVDNQWRTVQCYTALPYVCQIDPNAAPVNSCPTTATAQPCPTPPAYPSPPTVTCPPPADCPTPLPALPFPTLPACPPPPPTVTCPPPPVCPSPSSAATCPPPPDCPTPSPASACPTSAPSGTPYGLCSTGRCPDPTYTLNRDTCRCYKEVAAHTSYNDSLKLCANEGATLPIILNENDNSFITRMLSTGFYWLGLRCITTTNCIWQDGTPQVYGNFAPDSPQRPLGADYVIGITGNWFEVSQYSTAHVICQKMGIP